MGKVHGIRVAHIGSGLRSFRLGHPFPEEITRLVTFWMSDLYFCPGEWAVRNLRSFKGTKIDTKFNTLLDSLELAQTSRLATVPLPTKPYCIVTLHRFENVYRKEVFIRNLDLIEIIAKHMRVVFILHPLTQKKLLQFNLFDRLSSNSNIELHKRYDYFRFVKIIIGSEFLVSDGGSNQEECFYLGKPCLLLRKATERQEGLGRTTVISHYDATTVEHFLSNYKNLIQSPLVGTLSPSEIIIEHCLKADGARTK